MVLRVKSEDGISLAVAEAGTPDGPTVVCVHGYPDNRSLWDPVAGALGDRYRVISYDVRGAGESDKPRGHHPYHLDLLEADLAAVIDEVSPDQPVHLLAHDWGAIQSWHAVTGERLRGRIASFTSISGPCLDHAGFWLRSRFRPWPRALRDLAGQLAHSLYIAWFQLPGLPELAWRTGVGARVMRRLDSTAAEPAVPDAVHGLGLYRANMLPRLLRPEPRRTGIPVQVLAPTEDGFVGPALQTSIARWAADLRVREIPGGHWLPRQKPDVIARCAAELIEHVEGGDEPRSLRRARLRTGKDARFAEQLVVITGAGDGIGRATALAFAEMGAELALTDVDEVSLRRTAELAKRLGAQATVSVVDVADTDAMTRFAKQVRGTHGAPDIVVNNAGIGMVRSFGETTPADWERIVDVNLWGVIHGCRFFAQQMRERGEGGHIVNIASAAAYRPSKLMPAYATTKSAVLMLSECLRAELAADGIGVTAICPAVAYANLTAPSGELDAGEETTRRRVLSSAYRRRDYQPEKVAEQIVRAIERNAPIA